MNRAGLFFGRGWPCARAAVWTSVFGFGAFAALGGGVARADTIGASIPTPLPVYSVGSNGTAYSLVQGANADVVFSVTADAEFGGQVTSLSYSASSSVEGASGGLFDLWDQNDSDNFSGLFHKKETLFGTFAPSDAGLVGACNHLADALRAGGQSDAAIFSQDRPMTLELRVTGDAGFSGAGWQPYHAVETATTQLTCKKWSGVAGVVGQAGSIAVAQGVSDAHLTLIEQYGPSGLCQVTLSGVITTTAPTLEVQFRYEHFDGQQSDIKTVTTNQAQTAMFSHEYSIPNESGPEGGSIKIVGVAPAFESNQAAYSMDCQEGGTSSIQTALLPEVFLQAGPQGETKIGSQLCPTHLRMQGKIEGQGGGSMVGQAFFAGPGYASAHHDYLVSGEQSVLINGMRPLEWNTGPQYAIGGAMPSLMSQTLVVGFNVLGENSSQIANVPQQAFELSCEPVPGVTANTGGFAPQTGPPSSMPTPLGSSKAKAMFVPPAASVRTALPERTTAPGTQGPFTGLKSIGQAGSPSRPETAARGIAVSPGTATSPTQPEEPEEETRRRPLRRRR